MSPQEISLRKKNSVLVPEIHESPTPGIPVRYGMASKWAVELANLGYIPSENLLESIVQMTTHDEVEALMIEVLDAAKKLKGDDVEYVPFYPNFPGQVMEMSDIEWIFNALTHYWTNGEWKPDTTKQKRPFSFERVEYTTLEPITLSQYQDIFNEIAGSVDSISDTDKNILKIGVTKQGWDPTVDVTHKEIACFLAGLYMEMGRSPKHLIKTTTDVLRLATHLSGGDISLAEDTKFKLSRPYRRVLNELLLNNFNAEDIQRHRNKWIKLFHTLHVGEYSEKLRLLAQPFRDGKKVTTFNSRVEAALLRRNAPEAVSLLKTRPGEFARRLAHLLTFDGKNVTLDEFEKIVDGVSTRVLTQLAGAVKLRERRKDTRIVFPKGPTSRATILRGDVSPMSTVIRNRLVKIIYDSFIRRFSGLESLGKVYVDESLRNAPIPTGQRSASEGLFTVARGTRLPFGGSDVNLRFFIYWVGRDIDLSATYHDENFNYMSHVSYTRLANTEFNAYHSGDITRAPDGAAEFIDVDIEGAIASGARYVVMNVYVYSGPTFAEHSTVYAGWMTRKSLNSNEVFDPTTVDQRVSLTASSKIAIPVVFDLVNREAIWMDMSANRHPWGSVNLENNKASTQDIIEASANIMDSRMSLYDLFSLHATARGQKVDSKEEADQAFELSDAFEINRILNELMS